MLFPGSEIPLHDVVDHLILFHDLVKFFAFEENLTFRYLPEAITCIIWYYLGRERAVGGDEGGEEESHTSKNPAIGKAVVQI